MKFCHTRNDSHVCVSGAILLTGLTLAEVQDNQQRNFNPNSKIVTNKQQQQK